MVNKSASRIGTIKWADGGRTNTRYIGYNSNTGQTIVWQHIQDRRSSRSTGRNIGRLLQELDEALANGDTAWLGEVDTAALDALRKSAA